MQRNTTVTRYFTPETITHLSARDAIDRAYATAGLTPPSRVDAITAILAAEPEPHEIAATYAAKSLEGGSDAKALAEEALTAWQRAVTVETFRTTYDRVVDAVAGEKISELRSNTITAVTKPFNTLVKRLEKAAVKLDQQQPLNRERAFEQDTTAEVKEAEAILTTLSAFAFTPAVTVHGNAAKLLAIVSIPEVEQEVVTRTFGGSTFVAPADSDSQRSAVRAMLRAAEDDLDTTLVNIARGRWNNIQFAIADDQEMQRREQAHHNATVRKTDNTRDPEKLVRII